MKIKQEELDKILKKPGYFVRANTNSAPPGKNRTAEGKASAATAREGDSAARHGDPAAAVRKESKLEIRFSQQLAVDGMPPYQRNYFFLPDRDLELDFAWPKWKIAVEIQGGAHRASLKLLDRDCEKLSLGLLTGWTIMPLGPTLVKSGRGLEMLLELIRQRKGA